jgi:hypothetical protein
MSRNLGVRRLCGWGLLAVGLLAVGGERAAQAGPWTRDKGKGYLNLSYSRIAAARLFFPDGTIGPIAPYEQHALQLYGELGLVDRYLTASFEGQLFRYNRLVGQGATYGMGDMRLGFWSGLVTKPLRVTGAILLGIPSGDPAPKAGSATADLSASDPQQSLYRAYLQDVARTLPTGDGEVDVELRVSLGTSFGKVRRWPLEHFLIAEAGYQFRTHSRAFVNTPLDEKYADALSYKIELGTKFPWPVLDRFWFIFRMPGLVSFALFQDPGAGGSGIRPTASCTTGLGNGVSYFAYGFEVLGRVYKGLGASFGLDSALGARCVAAGANLKAGLSVEW